MDEGSLGVHQVELVVETRPGFGDRRRVAHHAHGALDLGEVAAGDDRRRLVVDTYLEAGGAPVDELDRALRLDGGDGGVDVLRDDVAAVEAAAGHVLAVTRVALHHLVGRLEAGVGDLCGRQLLVVRLLGGDDRSVVDEREVDARVGNQIGLELRQIDVEGTVEAKGGGDGADALGDDTVEVGVRRPFDVEVSTADVVDRLVVDHEADVGVLQRAVGRQDGVVRLDDGGRDLRRRVDGAGELRLLAVVDAEAFHQQRRQAGAGAATEAVEDEEALKAGTLIGELADAVENEVDDLLADGVVTAGVVVGGVFLAGDERFRMEELTVGSSPDLICSNAQKTETSC